jgi:hypothetical protein
MTPYAASLLRQASLKGLSEPADEALVGRSEPFTHVRFTTLGRGLDPESVMAFVSTVAERLATVEAMTLLLNAYADAAQIRHGADDEAMRIRSAAYALIASVHDEAMAEVERLEAGCRGLSRLLEDVDAVLAPKTDGTDGIHIIVDPDSLAVDPAFRS